MNGITFGKDRKIRAGVKATGPSIVLGEKFTLAKCIKRVPFFAKDPPFTQNGQVCRARPVRVRGQILLKNTDLFPGGILVRIEARSVRSLNAQAIKIESAEWWSRRGQPAKCDALFWLKPGGKALVDFGNSKCQEVLVNQNGTLVLERYNPYR
jgi:hypothetical protein